jgi:enamine deaminase RidA (YjgF/YER057c/UK114 family)
MTVFQWLGTEFVAISCEGDPHLAADAGLREVLGRCNECLVNVGLSLDDTVRTRLWGKDRPARDLGSQQRVKSLAGKARSASSSFIAPDHFDADGCVALDLLAMRPINRGAVKVAVEYDPPIVPVRYIVYESVVVLSGVTAVLPTLGEQMADILPRISESLADAGTSWERVARVSCYLHRSQDPATLKSLFRPWVKVEVPQFEYAFVDGYSSPGKLIEIEVTATR